MTIRRTADIFPPDVGAPSPGVTRVSPAKRGQNPFGYVSDEIEAGDAVHRQGTVPPVLEAGDVLVTTLLTHKYDGVRHVRGQQYAMADYRVAANEARGLVKRVVPEHCDWWGAPGRVLVAEPADDVRPLLDHETPGALRIVQGAGYDPGSAAFRFHSALNECTKHASAFFRAGDSNPYSSLRQYDMDIDAGVLRDAVLTADVLHNHADYWLLNNTGLRERDGQLVIRHYHGSKQHGTNLQPALDLAKDARLLGARLSLVKEARDWGRDMTWCPIPVPVARYAALRDAVITGMRGYVPLDGEAATAARPLRIAHSPTDRKAKGTEILVRVVQGLRMKAVPVELVLIENTALPEALRLKATCDVCFDSFWLGMQGSGLEAAAMGLPVIAGDSDVLALYAAEGMPAPYTFAIDATWLADILERLAVDPAYRLLEAARAFDYVSAVHDYPAVAARYEATLAGWLHRPDVITDRFAHLFRKPDPATHVPPAPATHGIPPQPATHKPRTPRRGTKL